MTTLPPGQTLTVTLTAQTRTYPLVIARGVLTRLGTLLAPWVPAGARLLLVSDTTVDALYGEAAFGALHEAGYAVARVVIPPGEPSKTLAMAETVYEAALAHGLGRRDAMIALGGGVVGDLTGFCAATYYRGTGFVQIPTTLLAQIDSSVGGKTAVNFRTVKNGIGVFYQPTGVLMDPAVLATLPVREARAGLAEAAKYALLETTATGAGGFLGFLHAHAGELATLATASDATLCTLIARCCQIKAEVVAADETERSGARAMLNLGHTFAHALEASTGYTTLLHGEAVAMGLAMALDLAVRVGRLPASEAERALSLLRALSLPRIPPQGLSIETLLALMAQDKKAHGGEIRFVLPVGRLGEVSVNDTVPLDAVRATLSACLNA